MDKADLFYENLEETVAAYSSGSKDGFAGNLTQLQRRVGQDYFRWEVVPVCALPEDFVWNGHTVVSNKDSSWRDDLLARFVDLIVSYCR